jgi:hypothetical protein
MPDLGPDTGAWHGRGQRYELGGVARWVLELVDGADDRQERISGRTSSASIAPVGGQHPHIAAGPVSRRVTARGALSPCREARAIARFAAVRADVSQRQPLPCQPSDWIFTTETG